MIKLCIFDCDGTLVDSQHSIVEAMAAAFESHDLDRPTADSVRRVVGLPLITAIARLHPGADDETYARLRQSYSDTFARLRRQGALREPLYPGALEVLDTIERAGWVLGMATGKSQRGTLATLAGHGLDHRFATLQTADVAAGKPSPDMVLRAMAETGADPAMTVMVGDTSFDMLMARAADVLAVGVRWGYHDEQELWAAGAHAVIGAFRELSAVIDGLLETS